jgi:NADH-quinone oxidoreductase subunit C
MTDAMSEELLELGEMIALAQPDAVVSHHVTHGELTVVATPSGLRMLVGHLRDNTACAFTTLIDITAVDYPGREQRFDVVYHFLSMPQNQRVRVKIAVAEDQVVASITDLHPSADWFEREVFDMYGVMFSGHPDLRRILTDYGFRGHPLRKDFPTTGYVEVRYDETSKRVVYEPVKLVQDYRLFDFMSPWEGAQYILPGDEKPEPKPEPKQEG